MLNLNDPRYAPLRSCTALITGGAGFIGSHIAANLLKLGASVRVLDDLTTGHQRNIPQGAAWTNASILDDHALRTVIKGCDLVFHQAAMVSVPLSVEQPTQCVRTNIEGTLRVLQAALDAKVGRVLFAASAAAYGDNPTIPSSELHPPKCCSPYAVSKVAGEQLLLSYAQQGLSTCSLRYFNVFGPRQDPKGAYAAVISAFADRLASRTPVTIHGDGNQTRDFVAIDNVVHANLLAAASPRDLRGDIFNIGTGTRTTLLELYDAMARAMGASQRPIFGPPRAGDVRHSGADISNARQVLGYEPIVTLDQGLQKLLASL